MATPIGHVLAGYAVAGIAAAPQLLSRRHTAGLCMLMALAPDLDLLPRLLLGQPALFHGGISHSFAAALLAAGVVAGIHSLRGQSFRYVLALGFVAYTTHLLLDFLGPDNRYPYGLPLFWPMVDTTYLSPRPLLLGVRHASTTEASLREFIQGVASFRNLVAIGWEVVVSLPLVILGQWLGLQRRKRTQSRSLSG